MGSRLVPGVPPASRGRPEHRDGRYRVHASRLSVIRAPGDQCLRAPVAWVPVNGESAPCDLLSGLTGALKPRATSATCHQGRAVLAAVLLLSMVIVATDSPLQAIRRAKPLSPPSAG